MQKLLVFIFFVSRGLNINSTELPSSLDSTEAELVAVNESELKAELYLFLWRVQKRNLKLTQADKIISTENVLKTIEGNLTRLEVYCGS